MTLAPILPHLSSLHTLCWSILRICGQVGSPTAQAESLVRKQKFLFVFRAHIKRRIAARRSDDALSDEEKGRWAQEIELHEHIVQRIDGLEKELGEVQEAAQKLETSYGSLRATVLNCLWPFTWMTALSAAE